jgi:hypothetical protein
MARFLHWHGTGYERLTLMVGVVFLVALYACAILALLGVLHFGA